MKHFHWQHNNNNIGPTNDDIVGYDGLSHCRHQAIIWTNAGILSIGPYGTNFSEILIESHIISI